MTTPVNFMSTISNRFPANRLKSDFFRYLLAFAMKTRLSVESDDSSSETRDARQPSTRRTQLDVLLSAGLSRSSSAIAVGRAQPTTGSQYSAKNNKEKEEKERNSN